MRPGGFQRRFIFFRVKLRVLTGREGTEDIHGNLERDKRGWEEQEKGSPVSNTQRARSWYFTSPAIQMSFWLLTLLNLRLTFLINNPSCCWRTLLLLALPLFIQQKHFHWPLRAQTHTNPPHPLPSNRKNQHYSLVLSTFIQAPDCSFTAGGLSAAINLLKVVDLLLSIVIQVLLALYGRFSCRALATLAIAFSVWSTT